MEFDKPSTKYMFITIMVAFVIGLGYLGVRMYEYESKRDIESQRRRAACKELNLSFGDYVTVKEGFYKDILLVAVSPGLIYNSKGEFETYRLNFVLGSPTETVTFLCEDLQRVKL